MKILGSFGINFPFITVFHLLYLYLYPNFKCLIILKGNGCRSEEIPHSNEGLRYSLLLLGNFEVLRLHKSSMMAKRIIVRPCKTFRFNLASTKSFNADQ